MISKAGTEGPTQSLASFADELQYDSLPNDVRERMVGYLIDFFRVAAVGSSAPWVEKLKRALQVSSASSGSQILYSDERIDPVRAAFLNGTIAGSLEWDDTHVGAMLHPGVVVWPAIFAISEGREISGEQLIVAAVAGYETMIRVGLSVQPSHFKRGFQSTATCGVFGSAVAAAKVLGLRGDEIASAMGIAASYAGGLTQFFVSGSEVKRIHAGKASAAGVEAAFISAAGITGPHDIIEGSQGFAAAYADEFNQNEIVEGLGVKYQLLRLQLKPHACSARVLAAVEAAETLSSNVSSAEEIASVEIGVPSVIVGRLTGNAPADLQQSQMSSPFAVAMTLALARGRPKPLVFGVSDFENALQNPQVRELSHRTVCVIDDDIERWTSAECVPARVTVRTRNGSTFEATCREPMGCPQRPIDTDELISRLKIVTSGIVPRRALDTWIKAARQPEKLNSIGELLSLRVTCRDSAK